VEQEKEDRERQVNGRGKAKHTINWEKFGDRLRERRIEIGWSQEQLGDKANISANTISDLERARHIPSANTFTSVVTALGWDPDAAIHDL